MIINKPQWKIGIAFLVRYLAVLIVPIVLISVIYSRSIQTIETNTIESNISMLQTTKDTIESRIEEIDKIIEQVAWNTKVISFINVTNPFQGANTYRVIETRNELYNYRLTNNFIFDYYVIYLNSNIVIGPSQTYRLEQFYPEHFAYTGVPAADWLAEINSSYPRSDLLPERELIFKNMSHNVLPYIRDISITTLGRQCKIMFLLKTDEINHLLSRFDLSNGGWAYIADEKSYLFSSHAQHATGSQFRNMIADSGQLSGHFIEEINQSKMIVSYVISANTGLQYVAAQPYDQVMFHVASIRRLSLILFSVAILIGLLLSFFWATRNSFALKKTFEMLSQYDTRALTIRDPFVQVQNSVFEIIRDNVSLNQTIAQQATFLRSSFFLQLIYSDFSSEEDILTNAQYVGLDFGKSAYAAVVVQLLGYGHGRARIDKDIMQELDIRRLKVTEVMTRHRFTQTYFHDLSRDQIMLIALISDQQKENYSALMLSYMRRVQQILGKDHSIEVRFAWGNLCERAMDIAHTLHQDVQALDYSVQINRDGSSILYYPDVLEQKAEIFYPKEWEYRLINFTREGNADKVKEILADLQQRNIEARKLPVSMMKILFSQLYGTLLRTVQESSIDGAELDIIELSLKNLGEFNNAYGQTFQILSDAFVNVCLLVRGRKEDQHQVLIRELHQYLHDQYSEKDLSLTMLAEEFNYSPAYLSVFFKEHMGDHFSVYLEETRMNMAKRLLKESNLSITEISENVGYSSSNSFCRAFKRIYNVSPGQYRRDRSIPSGD